MNGLDKVACEEFYNEEMAEALEAYFQEEKGPFLPTEEMTEAANSAACLDLANQVLGILHQGDGHAIG